MKILLICAAGMSTSLLVTKMEKAAKERGLDVSISATARSEVEKHIAGTDVLLLGPQVSFSLEQMKKTYEPLGIRVTTIDTVDYGMMNGLKVLESALKQIN